jgi:tRNA (guanine-N7-)-methyltransferase
MATAIFKPADFFAPLDWGTVFTRPAPIEIEIGCGKGGFLAWAAATRPVANFLGLERQLVRLRMADKKVQRQGLTNVRLLRIEAGYFVTKMVPDGSVAAYHIYFPDPWPKRRHQRHRLINLEFVGELDRTLGPGGVVHVATDDLDYFASMQQVFAASRRFEEQPPEPLPVEAQTEFEKIFLAQGKPIGRARFVRRD